MRELQGNNGAPLSVFISYAHEDELLRQQLETHLSLLRRQGLISEWHDREILPGAEWSREIDAHLETASIILLLISADFLASDYCYDIEMQRALVRHEAKEARVIPIILRPVDWYGAPFGQLQSLPRDGKSVTEWDNQDAAFRDIAQGLRRVIEQRASSASPVQRLSPLDRQNRLRLLKRVRTTWVEGVLAHSLHQAALIALDLQEQPDTLANPWRLEVQETNLPPRPLPAGISIVQVYDEAEGELLLLGEPGAGKTTLLLELARDLLSRAELDETYLIPVVFNLSSWAERQQPLTVWLVEELRLKYQVPRKVGQAWVNTGQVLLLLDGLDEVAQARRAVCIDTINAYREKHNLVPIVVCSRSTEYLEQATRLLLHRAVIVQPLTLQQIDTYLVSAGNQLQALRGDLSSNPALHKLATIPLMLSVLTLTYHGKTFYDPDALRSPERWQQQIFTAYVQQMFQRRGHQKRYTSQQTIYWLTWLAKQMAVHHQTEFYIEGMQMDWLSEGWLYRLCPSIAVGLFYALFDTLIMAVQYGPPSGCLVGLFTLIIYVLLNGFVFGLLGRQGAMPTGKRKGPSWMRVCQNFIKLLGNRVVYGLLIGLAHGAFVTRFTWPTLAVTDVMFTAIAYGILGKLNAEIVPAEVLVWSWMKVRKNLFKSLLLGVLVAFIYRMFMGPIFSPSNLLTALAFALVLGLSFVVLGGLSNQTLEAGNRAVPNQGIRRSARNSILIGLVFGLISGLASYLIANLADRLTKGPLAPSYGMAYGVGGGLFSMAIAWLLYGGTACIQHGLLRVLLWRAKYIPWDYPHFLDFAAERILLSKVGGGYIFIHRLLLDYFASLEKNEP